MVNEVVDGIEGIRTAVHLCGRAGARARGEEAFSGGYGPIVGQLNRLRVQHLTMEFTAPQAGDVEVLRQLRDDLEIGRGRVSVTPGQVDSPEEIAGRVEQALRHVPANASPSTPTAASHPARRRRSASTRSTPSSRTR